MQFTQIKLNLMVHILVLRRSKLKVEISQKSKNQVWGLNIYEAVPKIETTSKYITDDSATIPGPFPHIKHDFEKKINENQQKYIKVDLSLTSIPCRGGGGYL